MSYRSNLTDIVAHADRNVADVNEKVAKRIEATAKVTAPRDTGKLADSVEARSTAGSSWRVRVPTWYAHFVEFGTSRRAARPFLSPAAEAQRAAHVKAVRDLYDDKGRGR